MSSSIQNSSETITTFVLVGLVEMEGFRYLYALIAFALYVFIMSVSSMIVYVIQVESSLHEPMYIFIGHLVVNSMMGSSAYLPKLFIDLLTGCSTISLNACLAQGFFIQNCAAAEFFAFTAIAYDRFLAVGHPLRYPTLMTNLTCVKVIIAIWLYILMAGFVGSSLMTTLKFCAVNINNVYCESLSLHPLACNDTTVILIYGTTYTLSFVIFCILVIIYSYIRTALICLKLSSEASHKATYTLVTHIMAFSIFMIAAMFMAFRYRVNLGPLPAVAHIVISAFCMSSYIIINPLIYGIRTEAVRVKIVQNLQKFGGEIMIRHK